MRLREAIGPVRERSRRDRLGVLVVAMSLASVGCGGVRDGGEESASSSVPPAAPQASIGEGDGFDAGAVAIEDVAISGDAALDVRAALVAAAEQAAAYSKRFKGHALLVMLDGEVVFERYEDGWSASRRHPLASGTKSFVGVLAAAAVEDGLITWEQPVAEVITEWQDDPAKSRITVRQLLELSSGLDPAVSTLGSGGRGLLGRSIGADRTPRRGAAARGEQATDKFAASVDVPMRDEPGTRFRYGPSHFFAFGEMLERVLEEARREGRLEDASLEAYLDRRVLAPIGLGGVARGWGRDRVGNLNLPGGARLTAREWARFGEFVRRGGRVDGPEGGEIEVIDEAELLRCFEPSAANPAYGLTWWLPRADAMETAAEADGTLADRLVARGLQQQMSRVPEAADGGADSMLRIWMAAGLGKQRLHLLPDHGLVVVRFGENFAGVQRFDDREILEPMLEAIRPLSTPGAPRNAD